MTSDQILAGGTFSCVGLFFVVMGLAFFLPTVLSWLSKRGVIAGEGVVVGYEVETSEESPTSYHILIKYRDETGAEHHAKVDGGAQKQFEIDQSVEILYRPDAPQAVWIVGHQPERRHWLFGAAFVMMGTLSLVMGISIWVFRIPVNRG
jgi:hypothetical protein